MFFFILLTRYQIIFQSKHVLAKMAQGKCKHEGWQTVLNLCIIIVSPHIKIKKYANRVKISMPSTWVLKARPTMPEQSDLDNDTKMLTYFPLCKVVTLCCMLFEYRKTPLSFRDSVNKKVLSQRTFIFFYICLHLLLQFHYCIMRAILCPRSDCM